MEYIRLGETILDCLYLYLKKSVRHTFVSKTTKTEIMHNFVLSQLADSCCPRDTPVDSSCNGRYLLHRRNLRHRAFYKPGANHESDRGLTLGLHLYPVRILIPRRAT